MFSFFTKVFRRLIVVQILSFCLFGCASSIVTKASDPKNVTISPKGMRYILQGDVDLNGQTFRIPKEVVLDCRDGVIKNGKVIGNQNKILYNAPFIGDEMTIEGCYVEDKEVRSEQILVKNHFSNQDIHNVFNLVKDGATVVFEQGIYKDVTHVCFNKNITIDFSNSIIETKVDQYGLSSSVFLTDVEPLLRIKNIAIKNVTIDGKVPKYGIESGIGPRRNAIRIVGAKNVMLDNVEIKNFRFGTSGDYSKDVKKRHMAGVCSIMNYRKCTIQNCKLSMNTGEGFYLVPEENDNNYLLFKGNVSTKNYGTFLTLVDGRCFVEDNKMDVFGLSGMNVFCYNSVIRNNHFKSGERFNCIDITENGLYWPRNVVISGNTADGCEGFIMASGENVTISDNKCMNPVSAFALTIYGYAETNDQSPGFLIQRGKAGGNVKMRIENNILQCRGGIATYPGCKGDLSIIGNTITIISDDKKTDHRGTAMEFYDCSKLIVSGNTFNDSFRNSITRANVYITIKNSTCDATIRGNKFNRTVSNADASHFLFVEDVKFENIIIEDNNSNVPNINARVVEGKIPVRGKKIVRNNGRIVIKGTALE